MRICRLSRFVPLVIFAGVFLPGHSTFAENVPDKLQGSWRIVGVYESSDIPGLDRKEQKKLLGTKLVFGANRLTSCGQSVSITSVISKTLSSDDLLGLTHTSFRNLGIESNTVEEIVLNNNASGNCLGTFTLPGEDVYLKNHNEICVNLDGVFFKATRIPTRGRMAAH